MKIRILLVAFLSLYLFSCSSDDDTSTPTPLGNFQDGLLITNQGPFNEGFGTVSFVSGLTTVQNDIFQTVNNDNLGNIVQSIGFSGNQAYIVANVSNRITVVNRFTFEEQARIDTGLDNPRFFIAIGNKGYVTNWGDGTNPDDDYVSVIDLTTNTITTNIPVAEGPESLVVSGNNIYVAHKGGFGVNNIISVIDASTDQVSTTIEVGDVPNSMQLDGVGNLWVLSGGNPGFIGDETAGSLSIIDLQAEEVFQTYEFDATEHPNALNLENGALYYYLNGGIYENTASFVDFSLPEEPILDGLNFFNMRIISNAIFGVNAGDFASNGSLEIYNLNTLELFDSLELGIIPDQIYIN